MCQMSITFTFPCITQRVPSTPHKIYLIILEVSLSGDVTSIGVGGTRCRITRMYSYWIL